MDDKGEKGQTHVENSARLFELRCDVRVCPLSSVVAGLNRVAQSLWVYKPPCVKPAPTDVLLLLTRIGTTVYCGLISLSLAAVFSYCILGISGVGETSLSRYGSELKTALKENHRLHFCY